MSLEELLDELSDFFLQSGFNYGYGDFSSNPHQIDALRQAIVEIYTDQAMDNLGVASAPVFVTITIASVNDVPVATDDSYSTNEDVALSGNVLSNDTDADNTAAQLSAALLVGPAHGTLTLNADGSFTYSPAANYNGPDGFAYKVSDPQGAATGGTPCRA